MDKFVDGRRGFEMPYAPAGTPTALVGKPEIYKHFKETPKAFATVRYYDVTIRPLLKTNETLVEFRSDSTVAATNKPLNNLYIAIVTFENNRIKRFREYFNPVILIEAMQPNYLVSAR